MWRRIVECHTALNNTSTGGDIVKRIWVFATCIVAIGLAGCGKAKVAAPSANDVTEFHAAVQDGDATIVDRLLKAKPSLVNAPNQNGETPLKVAKQKSNDELVEVIQKHGGHE
jgi:ankyrin repeat protein